MYNYIHIILLLVLLLLLAQASGLGENICLWESQNVLFLCIYLINTNVILFAVSFRFYKIIRKGSLLPTESKLTSLIVNV